VPAEEPDDDPWRVADGYQNGALLRVAYGDRNCALLYNQVWQGESRTVSPDPNSEAASFSTNESAFLSSIEREGTARRTSVQAVRETATTSTQTVVPDMASIATQTDLEQEAADNQAWMIEEALTADSGRVSTAEAVLQGKGVVDPGASKSFTSTYAAECERTLNPEKHGDGRISDVNVKENLKFGFGNSSIDTCRGTAKLALDADNTKLKYKFNSLDKGQGPMLLGADFLEGVGSIVDFGTKDVIYSKIAPDKLKTLETSRVGHLLISLTDDLLEGAQQLQKPVYGLRDLLASS